MFVLIAAVIVALPYVLYRTLIYVAAAIGRGVGQGDKIEAISEFTARPLPRSLKTGLGSGLLLGLILSLFEQQELAIAAPILGTVAGALTPSLSSYLSRAYADRREFVDRIGHRLFAAFFIAYTAAAIFWLMGGLAAGLSKIDAVMEFFQSWADNGSLGSETARNVVHASQSSGPGWEFAFDYIFSALNLGLGIFLFKRGPGHRGARLLALGMVGTAVAFNLQGHIVRAIIPVEFHDLVTIYHDYFIHLLSGLAYVFALLVFPDGRIKKESGPYLVFVAIFFGTLSMITIQDHTAGLLTLFGIMIPLAGTASQLSRYRTANAKERQQAKILFAALGLSLVAAIASVGVTLITGSDPDSVRATRDYTFTSPEPGTYYFFCDPHVSDMIGVLTVTEQPVGPSANTIALSAKDYEFSKSGLVAPADTDIEFRFTNRDADYHNVSIYRDFERTDPIFIGETFNGNDVIVGLFRAFRVLFVILPIALFAGILRYRIWAIDRLINRALVYGLLTAFLGGIYFGSVLGFSSLAGELTEDATRNPLVIVVSTLAAVGLANPVRRRLQGLIDRVFYRASYDPRAKVSVFSSKLRDELNIDTISAEMVSIVQEAVQPTYVSLWVVTLTPENGQRERESVS